MLRHDRIFHPHDGGVHCTPDSQMEIIINSMHGFITSLLPPACQAYGAMIHCYKSKAFGMCIRHSH